MKKEHNVSVRMEGPVHSDIGRVAEQIQQSYSVTSRLLIRYALKQLRNDGYKLLDYAKKNKL